MASWVSPAEPCGAPPRWPGRSPVHIARRTPPTGLVDDAAAVAGKLGERARVTQLPDLLLLAPDIQVTVLMLEAVDGASRRLRPVARTGMWTEQRCSHTDPESVSAQVRSVEGLDRLV